jgi:arylsulfatase A-like enzyme
MRLLQLGRRAVAFAVLAVAARAAAAGTAPRAVDHVVLVSIDGLRPEMYLDAGWPAPTIQQMAREGVRADGVLGVFPSVTYPSHTTIVTGALPARHGIYYNSPFEPGGETGRWYWEAAAIRSPTLWAAAHAAGLTTAAVSWPVSVGAEIDWNLPEVWSLEKGSSAVEALRRAAHPPGLLEEVEREATGRLRDALWDSHSIARDDQAGSMAAYLLETHRPNLVLLHLLGVDHFQHVDGREHPTVRQSLAAADRAVGKLVEAARRAGILERTAFVVTADHGFIDIHTSVAPNVWLVQAGLQEPQPDRGKWRATFHCAAAAGFLHLRDANDAEALAAAQAVLAAQPPGVQRLYQVIPRDELTRRGAAPDAALALAPEPGIRIVCDSRGPALTATHGATHGFLPELPQMHTGFIGWGKAMRAGGVVPQMALSDVAPLVAHLLGLKLAAPDGVLLPGLLAAPSEERQP